MSLAHAVPPDASPAVVVLDVNETLSDMEPLGRAFAAVGLDEGDAALWFATVLRDGFATTALGDNVPFSTVAQESLMVLAGSRGRAGDVEHVVATVMSALAHLDVHADVVEGLARLAERGLRLVTLSNGAATVAGELLDRAGARHHVEHVLSVEDAPAWKPDPRAYRYALEVCGVTAAEAVLVAVHPWDVAGAHRAGLRTAWLDRSRAHYPDYLPRPDTTVTSLLDLSAALTGPA